MQPFKLFCEKDIFGFEELRDKEPKPEKDNDLPLKSFSIQWLMDTLSRKTIHGTPSSQFFLDKIEWGEGPGSIRVKLTPNITVFIEKSSTNLLGETIWIPKKILKPKLKEYAGREEIVADEIFDWVKRLYQDKIENASEHYKIIPLVRRVEAKIRETAPTMFVFGDVKEVDETYYIIYFYLKGVGVGKLASRIRQVTQTPEATIDIKFDKNRGMIRVIVTTVSIGGEGDDWTPDIPYLDAWFAPSQRRDEIADIVSSAFRYF